MIFVFIFLRVSDFLHIDAQNRVSATYNVCLWVVSFADSQSQLLELILLVPNPSPGECLVWGLNCPSLRNCWEFCDIPFACESSVGVWKLTRLHLCPHLLISMCFSLIFLIVEGLLRIVLSVVVVLPCLWEIVSSRSCILLLNYPMPPQETHIILDAHKSSLKYFKWMKTEYLIRLQCS